MVSARAETRTDRAHKVGALVMLVVVLAAAVWAAMFGVKALGAWLFSKNEFFAVRNIDIRSNGRLSPGHIREYAGLREGMNLFDVSLAQIRRDLESVPVVKSATVQRRLPDTLAIQVTERVAVAKLAVPGQKLMFTIDPEGYVLNVVSRANDLPAISGVRDQGLAPGSEVLDPVLADALMAVAIADGSRLSGSYRMAAIDISHEEYLDLRLASGHRVLLSREDLKRKLDDLADIIAANQEAGRAWTVADLRVSKNYPVQ